MPVKDTINAVIPVILAGGIGTHLWPLSTKERPKQFLSLIDERTLLQNTVLRLGGIKAATSPMLICNAMHLELIGQQLAEINKAASMIIAESLRRNTAPAVAMAAVAAQHLSHDPILLVTAADSAITDVDKFYSSVDLARKWASQNYLVTFGIKPTRPETGYGYIKTAGQIDNSDGTVFLIEEFVEKPNLTTAESYVASGKYYWNSGMFMFRSSVFLSELQNHAPTIFAICKKVIESVKLTDNVLYLPESDFVECPNISIDYAVMEKTKIGAMIPLDAGWSDIGTWRSLREYNQKNGVKI